MYAKALWILAVAVMGCAVESESIGEVGQELGLQGQCKIFCDDGNDCTVDACAPTGGCQNVPRQQGDPCVDEERECAGTCFASYTNPLGVTYPGGCGCKACDGCLIGTACVSGNHDDACGNGGEDCVPCFDGSYCFYGECVLYHPPSP
jgi:hypothetical protein